MASERVSVRSRQLLPPVLTLSVVTPAFRKAPSRSRIMSSVPMKLVFFAAYPEILNLNGFVHVTRTFEGVVVEIGLG
ncbi:MAG: hypothetical protein ACI8Z1_002578 [Candidatus Azotimanducaceae bacterium]|jgi:hypothetical protein